MTHEELTNITTQTELIKAVAHLRIASTIEFGCKRGKLYAEIQKLIKMVEELIE